MPDTPAAEPEIARAYIEAPDGLESAGAKLFTDIANKWVLRADELRVLEDACGEADLVDDLKAAMVGQDRLVKGSQGQLVINPLISEQRQHRTALATLLKQLRLPDEADTPEARSTQARAAANSRWSKRAG